MLIMAVFEILPFCDFRLWQFLRICHFSNFFVFSLNILILAVFEIMLQ